MTSRTERLLIDDVEEYGYVAMRSPASGSRPDHDAGDIWICRGAELVTETAVPFRYTDVHIVEEKYHTSEKKKSIQVERKKLERMCTLAQKINAVPLLAVRWSTRLDDSPGSTHYMIDPLPITRKSAEHPSVSPEYAEDEGMSLERYFGNGDLRQY